jgi:tRNA(Ile)-lysidine synthetase-like protein
MYSAGTDSAYLLEKMIKSGERNISLIHVNYGEIAENKELPTNIAKAKAKKYNIDLHVAYCDKENASEEYMRNFRYNFAVEVMRSTQEENPILLTAHHLGDRLETLVMNLMRGTALNGLVNMRESENKVVDGFEFTHKRPLLNTEKKDILRYIDSTSMTEGVDYFNDPTNFNGNNKRSLIRHSTNALMELYGVEGLRKTLESLEQEDKDIKTLSIQSKKEIDKMTLLETNYFSEATESSFYYLVKDVCDQTGLSFSKKTSKKVYLAYSEFKSVVFRLGKEGALISFDFIRKEGAFKMVCIVNYNKSKNSNKNKNMTENLRCINFS